MPQVLIQTDESGEWPIVVDDGEMPHASEGVSFRYVCDVGTVAEGNAVRSAWLSRRLTPEGRRWLDEQRVIGERELREQTGPDAARRMAKPV